MSHLKNPRLKRLPATLATAILAGATIFAVATTAKGASHRAQAAAIDLTQTCSTRVEPGARSISRPWCRTRATSSSTSAPSTPTPATPENAAGRHRPEPLPHSGDTNNNGFLDPARGVDLLGLVHGADREDATNIVGVDAVSAEPGVRQRHRALRDRRRPAASARPDRRCQGSAGPVLIKKAGRQVRPAERPDGDPDGLAGQHAQRDGQLTAGLGGGKTNSADFYQGIFTILQGKAKAFMTLQLGAATSASAGAARRRR